MQVKDNQERIEFFTSIAGKLTDLPPGCAEHKVLPGLSVAVDQADPNTAHVFLKPALQIGKALGDDAFQEAVLPKRAIFAWHVTLLWPNTVPSLVLVSFGSCVCLHLHLLGLGSF